MSTQTNWVCNRCEADNSLCRCDNTTPWLIPEIAPKDGTQIIGCFGKHGTIVLPCVWNSVDKRWMTSVLQANLYHGKWNDYYFETASEKDGDLIGWMQMPEFNS